MKTILARARAYVRTLTSVVGAAVLLAAANTAAADAAIRSDEFDGPVIDASLWTFVDPVGDATLSATGGHAAIAVPGFVDHDIWLGANRAPRLLQAAPDEDFEIEVKLDSAVDEAHELQGLVVEQGTDDLLRVDFYHDGTSTRLFAATFTGGSATVHHNAPVADGAPAYLRLARDGDGWTVRHSRDGAAWTTATTFHHAMAVGAVGPFAGNAGAVPPSFSAAIDHFRVVVPDEAPPAVSALATAPGTISAEVSWTTDEPATSTVAYGTDAAYAAGTASIDGSRTQHSIVLQRLACGQTYHFQARSVDAAGNAGASPDGTFTTGPCPDGLVSDEFDGAALDPGVWTFVDPVGDAHADAGDGAARIALPAGSDHDLWVGAKRAPRLLQAAPDEDFEIELKLASAVDQAYELQGLVVEQDADDLLRLDVYHDGSSTRLFAASLVGGSATVHHNAPVADGAPAYLRLARDGDSWTARHSEDGVVWSTAASFHHAMTVTAAGPFAGNTGGAPPGFTAAIDHFREVLPDGSAPVLSDVGAAPGTISAEIAWTTDEPATSTVAYGTDAADAGGTASNAGLATEHAVVLHGLRCEQAYRFQARSVDAAGNEGNAPDGAFTTGPCPDGLVSDEFDGTALDTGVWTVIDPVGDAVVDVGDGRARIALPAGVDHDVWTGATRAPRLLQPAPDEDFEVEAKFASAVGAAYQMEGLVVAGDGGDLLRVDVYHDGSSTRLFAASFQSGVPTVRHDAVVEGGSPAYLRLTRGGDQWTLGYSRDGQTWLQAASFTHVMRVSAVGPFAGNSGLAPPAFEAEVDYFRDIPPDLAPPEISSVSAEPGPGSTVRVTWTTDEVASSEVAFGETAAYGDVLATPGETTSHSVLLHGLACGTTHHLQPRSTDASGNGASSPDATVTTLPCPDAIASDEFDGPALETGRWAFVDPRGDATLSIGAGAAAIDIPAGVAHDLWPGARMAPRLLQAMSDESFEVEIKLDSQVAAEYQMQGLVVEESHDRLLRVEAHFEGASTKLFVAALADGSAEVLHHSALSGAAPAYMRLRRAGDGWTLLHSADGDAWTTAASFTHTLVANAIGPFVGNTGSSPPAFEGRFDHFREVTDRTPPAIAAIAARPRSRSAVVSWTTDEPASSTVEYAPTDGAWAERGEAKLGTRHYVVLPDLVCGAAYSYRVRSTDGLGNEAVSAEQAFTTAACPDGGGPDIELWDGEDQAFGGVGIPQTWVNVMGNVSDPDGVASLAASLNGGPARQLGIGPDGWRLERKGDFNAEIHHDELLPGANTLELRAVDAAGDATTRQVAIDWRGESAGEPPDAAGPVLVITAQPGDESLGMAGVVHAAKAAGRRVVVTAATNGDSSSAAQIGGECGAPDAAGQAAAALGLTRGRETVDAAAALGLTRTADVSTSEVMLLGYPEGALKTIAESSGGWTGDRTGLHRTYAEDFDGDPVTCDGDFRKLLDGTHSELSRPALAADLDALLATVSPTDVYTHSEQDSGSDQRELYRQVVAAIRRADARVRLHTTLLHGPGAEACMSLAAARWPNPALEANDPFARFTPTLGVTAPPAEPCDAGSTETSWGPLGPPSESVEVPAAMQAADEQANLKWQAISSHETQIDCSDPTGYHVSCGWRRAFAKLHELFWRHDYRGRRTWPAPYTAQWTSQDSIAEQAQTIDGEWRYDDEGGVRPLGIGFDRLLGIGDVRWTDYEVSVPIALHSLDVTKPHAGVGVALGWQGHTDSGQPRQGHPLGGLCMYYRQTLNEPLRLHLIYSPGPVNDTIVERRDFTMEPGVPYVFRFRQEPGQPGATRYSCKVWSAESSEPAEWTLSAEIPFWPGETSQRRGSALLVAHESDATFGSVGVTSLGD